MSKLHQIVAVVNGQKSRSQKELTELHHKALKGELFQGISRTYQPKEEDGEKQPPEKKNVQVTVDGLLIEAEKTLQKLFEVVELQDRANCSARSDVVVGTKVIAKDVPVTHLLFLEKQVQDIYTFVSKLPTLDPADEWNRDNTTGNVYRSQAVETIRTKKIPRTHIAHEPTKEHPAQVVNYHEDVPIGTWTNIKFSGAIAIVDKNKILDRVTQVLDAVKQARERANEYALNGEKADTGILDYIFHG